MSSEGSLMNWFAASLVLLFSYEHTSASLYNERKLFIVRSCLAMISFLYMSLTPNLGDIYEAS